MSHQPTERWSDERLEQFYTEFKRHIKDEEVERNQQQQIYDAIFRQEDLDKGVSAGILQTLSRVNDRSVKMEKWFEEKKSFLAGILFAVLIIWAFFTGVGQKILTFLGVKLP